MKKVDHHKYGEGEPTQANPEGFDDRACCKGSPGYRTDYSATMEHLRGPRTYPSVRVMESAKLNGDLPEYMKGNVRNV